jgi:outer membrane cobalamin receptor
MFINTLNASIPECPFPIRHTSVSAAAAEFNWKGLKVNANLAATYISEVLRTGEAPEDKFRLSPMIGVNWNIYKGLYMRASWKDSFRVPTFNDLYYARVGNRSLRPESGWQSNLGLTLREKHRFGSIEISADAYFNKLKDKITAIPTMFIWSMQNVGKVWMYGTDVSLSASFVPHRKVTIILNANYSLQYSVDVTDKNSKTYMHQTAYTPRHCGSSDLSIMTEWINICYRLNAAGVRYSKGQNIPANEIAGYADHCISINRNFDFGKAHNYKIGISLECLNLSGTNYEIIQSYPMPGRSFRISVKFKY